MPSRHLPSEAFQTLKEGLGADTARELMSHSWAGNSSVSPKGVEAVDGDRKVWGSLLKLSSPVTQSRIRQRK